MNTNKHKLTDAIIGFLKSCSMYYEDIDMEVCCDEFLSDMRAGLAGTNSSLAMIPTYIEIQKKLPKNQPVIVIDAGGTHFRAAIVHFEENGKAVINNLRKNKMPGIEKEVSREEFFDVMAGYIKDIAPESNRIGFCFSYPCEIMPNKDGKLLRFSKEIKSPQLIGQMIGENLNRAFARIGIKEQHYIVILNDTVTTLLAGMAGFEDINFDSYIGFILGTGTNTCYIEKNSNIIKVKNLDPQHRQIINVESGGYGKAPRGKIDLEFDASTINPGQQNLEKMMSGAYLGPLCLKVIQTAARNKIFSTDTASKTLSLQSLQTKDISDFLNNPHNTNSTVGTTFSDCSDSELTAIHYLLSNIVERAAKLTAINLAAVVMKSEKGKNSDKPVCIVAEGTTFYSLPGLKEKTEKYMQEFLVKQKSLHYEITYVENATLIGAAIAGLTN